VAHTFLLVVDGRVQSDYTISIRHREGTVSLLTGLAVPGSIKGDDGEFLIMLVIGAAAHSRPSSRRRAAKRRLQIGRNR
jgi:hypothetical protein